MDLLTIVLIAFGLALDAFAVSVARGVTVKSQRFSDAFVLGLSFGLFQVVMPSIGWLTGERLRGAVSDFDHWVAFGLLSVIGCKMIYESLMTRSGENNSKPLNLPVLLALSIATSIDALAVGVTLAFLTVSIITPLLVTGVITFIMSFSGVYLGNRLGHVFGTKIEGAGGLILIGIGVRILVEGLLYGV